MLEVLNYFIPDPNLFVEQEFVSDDIYNLYHKKNQTIWSLLSPNLLYSVQQLRIRANCPFIINNWHKGKDRKWSGFRTPKSLDYSATSKHSHGEAIDIIPIGKTAEEIRKMILSDPFCEDFKYITALEMTKDSVPITWVHLDVRNHDKKNLGIMQIHV